MKNIVDFPDKAALDEQAAQWLVRLDSDEPLTDEERRALAEWLQRSPRHRERLTSLADFWERMNALTELAVPLAPTRANSVVRPRSRAPLLAVATVVVTAVAAVLLLPIDLDSADVTSSNGLYSSAIGEQRSAILADGSELVLNTNSQIRVDYSAAHRDIRLIQGEVMFTVSEDADRPFRVFAGGGQIQAVGTAFSVYLKDDSVDITVTEGAVALSAIPPVSAPGTNDDPAEALASNIADLGTLRAGQIATLPRLDEFGSSGLARLPETRQVQELELTRRTSWTDGKLSFSGESLEHAVNEISRYTTVKIEFADPELRAIRVGGIFPVGETGAMFGALEKTFGLKVTYLSANRVLISAGD